MSDLHINTPGVYIQEIDAFGNSIVPVPTAVPAFIGYTPQASYQGKSLLNKPVRITSFQEFKTFFCHPDPLLASDHIQQYSPQYYLIELAEKAKNEETINLGSKTYTVLPDPDTIYYMYNSVRLFYQNGGGDAYIVSVGDYGHASQAPIKPDTQIVNSNVKLNDLMTGLELLKKEQEPTMYICPDATLLSPDNHATLVQTTLLQCEELQSVIGIFDIIGARNPDPILYTQDIETFRNGTGNDGLSYGAAYYPFIGTTILQPGDLDYTNLLGGDIEKLGKLLNPDGANAALAKIITDIQSQANPRTSELQHDQSLRAVSPDYASIIDTITRLSNILPPSPALAGVMTHIDNSDGVWKAPANTSIVGAASLTINISSKQQEDLNVDAVSGKSINALRAFPGMGILIWGARTLLGNSNDWRYINVRRTLIFIEQSVKGAARAYVFEPNDANTWRVVSSMISNFLTNVWKQGGLVGATPSDAFSVAVGLGSTMTAQDVLDGIMRVSVKVAVSRPAEFIEISFQQEMQQS